MITPRRTRLVRVPDLHAFRRTIACLVSLTPAGDADRTLVLVPTGGAVRQLVRALGGTAVAVLTRDELYDWLHARLPGAARRLSAVERDALAQAAAHEAAAAMPAGLPFSLRPGLVAEMLRFYDQLRRQSQRLERFQELIADALGGSDDRGADRLLAQTRFLTAALSAYERRAAASGGWDEHMLRERLSQVPLAPTPSHIIITTADWIAEPDGLYVGDFDLFARMPDLAQLELVCTEQVLGSGFHERIHDWWPGVEEVDARDFAGPFESIRPTLEVPAGGSEAAWFTVRDREDELAAVAQHVKAVRRAPAGERIPLDRTAVVFKHPLPYLYLADATLGAAGVPYEAADALPLAGEPFVATVDLVLDAVQSAFAREALLALIGCPHLAVAEPSLPPGAIAAFDAGLRERGYIGDLARLEEIATAWPDDPARPALAVALTIARALAPLQQPAPASEQIRRVLAFLRGHERPLDETDPFGDREARARASIQGLLGGAADAHAAHHDPPWTIDDLAAAIRRWIEDETFAGTPVPGGVQLLDDRAARYGSFDDVTIVGLVDAEWPERQARNIFYSSGLLKSLGWPSEHTRRRASDARFVDLLGSASRRVAVSTILLEDDAIVMRSMQLDEIGRARLSTVPSADRVARITADHALSTEPASLDPLDPLAREWASHRIQRTGPGDPRFHGAVGGRGDRVWSVSALETYLSCPFKFFAQHVLRLEEEPEDSDVMNPREQGQFVHGVFEAFFAAWRAAGRGAITAENLDQARHLFAEVVEQALTRLPEAEAGLERTRLLGSSAAAGLGEAVMRMEAERPVAVIERWLEMPLKGPVTIATATGPRLVAVRGKADRIDLLADGTFRLIDYKLGWPPQRTRALQLPIYALAAQQQLRREDGRSWEIGEALYLPFKGPRRVVPLVGAHGDRAKALADAQQRVADTLDAISRGEFPARPEDVYLCESCSYAAVCRKDYPDDAAV